MATFQVFFDAPSVTYRPGDMVTGRVRLLLSHTVTLRGIELLFRGHSSVGWEVKRTEQDENNRQQTVQIPYNSEELYFQFKFFIYGDAYSGNVFHAGQYDFNFTMQLPLNLPSSFEGEHGFIRHEMIIISYPPIGNGSSIFLLKVLNPLDLNTEYNIKNPVRVMDEKTLCCWCCASSPISCSLYLHAAGFTVGQHIPVTVDVDNLSDKTVKGVTVTLRRVDTFTAVRPERDTKKATHTLAVQLLESVPGRKSKSWDTKISVPEGPGSGLKYCSIITSKYFIDVNVELPAPHVDLTLSTPVTVGNIPLAIEGPPASCSLPPGTINHFLASADTPPPHPFSPVPTAPQEVISPELFNTVKHSVINSPHPVHL